MIAISDVHGQYSSLDDLLKTYPDTLVVQLGDLGMGFAPFEPPTWPDRFRFIRGNHDNPELCRAHPNYLGEFGFKEKLGLFFFSGARSTDRGVSNVKDGWWPDEELSNEQCYEAYVLYKQSRPKIVVSHEAPAEIVQRVIDRKQAEVENTHRQLSATPSRTSQLLDVLLALHKPKFWLFGHHHVSYQETVGETTFICAPALGVIDLRPFL